MLGIDVGSCEGKELGVEEGKGVGTLLGFPDGS